jgi:hypothetical protein
MNLQESTYTVGKMNLRESTQVIDCHKENVTVGIIQSGGEIRSNRRPLCMSFAKKARENNRRIMISHKEYPVSASALVLQ